MSARSEKIITREEARSRLIYLISTASDMMLEELMDSCFGYDELYIYAVVDESEVHQG